MSSPHVVQAILEQFTRCLHPDINTDGGVASGGAANLSPRTTDSGRASPFERMQDAFKDIRHRRSGDSLTSKSSNESKTSQGSDVVAKAKKAAALPSPEILEEKSYKRKLEIFRTRDSPDIERQMNHPVNGRAKMSNDLIDDPPSDSSDEEIKNLTSNRSNRFACGMNMGPIKQSKPVANFTKFFNIGREGSSPFGLCFATPVRAASPEDIASLSDDKLTTAEFLERHGRSSSPGGAPDLVRDSLRGSDSISDDGVETVNSTLYFESKYNNVIQTRPPMPLFLSQSITVTPSKTDELSEMIKKRSEENNRSSRRGRRNISPRKKSTKTNNREPPSPNSVAELPHLAEI